MNRRLQIPLSLLLFALFGLMALPGASALFGRAYTIAGEVVTAAADVSPTARPAGREVPTVRAAGSVGLPPSVTSTASSSEEATATATSSATATAGPPPTADAPPSTATSTPASTATATPSASATPATDLVEATQQATSTPTASPTPTATETPDPCRSLDGLLQFGPARQRLALNADGANAVLTLSSEAEAPIEGAAISVQISGGGQRIELLQFLGQTWRNPAAGDERLFKLERVLPGETGFSLELHLAPVTLDASGVSAAGDSEVRLQLLLPDCRDRRLAAEAVIVLHSPAPQPVPA